MKSVKESDIITKREGKVECPHCKLPTIIAEYEFRNKSALCLNCNRLFGIESTVPDVDLCSGGF